MSNLALTQSTWNRIAREFFATFLAPMRELREFLAKLTRERVQVWPINDCTSATPQITALTFSGVNYGTNTTKDGLLFVRFVANAGNWDVSFYTAVGASGLVAKATNVAASGTGAVAAQNSSGLTGSITLGATVVGETNDRHQVRVVVDYPARLPLVFTGVDGVTQDRTSRDAASGAYSSAAVSVRAAIAAIKNGAQAWATQVLPDVPVARLNAVCGAQERSLATETVITDTSGNITRLRGGLLPIFSDDMQDELTAGEQDILRRLTAAGAGVFDGGNTGLGTLAATTPQERCPAGTWTFQFTRGADTGDLGREVCGGTFSASDGSEGFSFDGLMVEKLWTGPRGLGPLTLKRTYTKTGDGSNLNLAAVALTLFDGVLNANSDNGILYWSVAANGGAWDYSFFRSSARTSTTLVAKATSVATGAAFSATAQNGSGLTVNWTSGLAPVDTTTGTVTCNPFLVLNASGFADKFTVTTSVTGTPGIIQRMMSEVFDFALNSDTSGNESLPDTWLGPTFFPYLTLDL